MKIGLSPIDLYIIRTTSLRGTRYEVRQNRGDLFSLK